MQAGVGALLHDAAILDTFADFIEQYCKEQERSQRYIDASGDFFRYTEDVARGIKLKVRADVKRAFSFPPTIAASRIGAIRREILTFKGYLRLLHTLIKPAADAHTLTIPASLVKLACEHLRQIEGMNDSKVVVLLTPHLNYFQRPHTEVREQAERVEKLIPKAEFPEKLGFIELPYSQGPSFFTNLAIYHEIGHFVYEEIPTLPALATHVADLKSATDEALSFRSLKKDVALRALAKEVIESWKQEIFCDLFALHLIGPAFSFALVEILNLRGSGSSEAMVMFDQEHPAPAYRLAEHVRFLRDDSAWWEAIANIDSEQKKLIERLAATPRSKYQAHADNRWKGLMDAFLDKPIVPSVRELVRKLVPNANSAATSFTETQKVIEECLNVGVVPHANPAPDPVSIINSAFCFYLTALADTVAKFEGEKKRDDVEIRGKWARKLEDWTRKAIEDSQIRTQFERRHADGPVQE